MSVNFAKFNDLKVLVFGDVMLDQYMWGTVDRISPEAPVPVVALAEKTVVAGGAANVAANVAGLGATPLLFGVIGKDEEAKILSETLRETGVSDEFLTPSENRPTSTKIRVVANHQQVVRVDREESDDLEESLEDEVWKALSGSLDTVDIVVVSDYAKGAVTKGIVTKLIRTAKEVGKRVLVDPKGKNYEKYRGAYVLTPNKKEAYAADGIDDSEDVEKAGLDLLQRFDLENLVITRGEEGMSLFSRGEEPSDIVAEARKVFDVTGAGDTVIATIGVALGAGSSFVEACKLANTAGGIVVERVGTTPIMTNDLTK